MADLVVIVPSRGRPAAAAELAETFVATCTGDTTLVVAVDEDDPAEYSQGALRVPSRNMGQALTMAVAHVLETVRPFAIGFMGDDHRPKTIGWDTEYLKALRELGTGIVYGNDLFQRHRLPTQCAMTTDIIQALGYMFPPALRHLYLDNFWRDLGKAAGCLRYLKDVTVEHRHPHAGKAAWDANYLRVNSTEMGEHDRIAYEAYLADGFADDVAKVRALREVAV